MKRHIVLVAAYLITLQFLVVEEGLGSWTGRSYDCHGDCIIKKKCATMNDSCIITFSSCQDPDEPTSVSRVRRDCCSPYPYCPRGLKCCQRLRVPTTSVSLSIPPGTPVTINIGAPPAEEEPVEEEPVEEEPVEEEPVEEEPVEEEPVEEEPVEEEPVEEKPVKEWPVEKEPPEGTKDSKPEPFIKPDKEDPAPESEG